MKQYCYNGVTILAESYEEAVKVFAFKIHDENDEWGRDFEENFEENFDESNLEDISELEANLKTLDNIGFVFYYRKPNDLENDNLPKVKLQWWVDNCSNKKLSEIEELINVDMEDDFYWIFDESVCEFSEWFSLIEQASELAKREDEVPDEEPIPDDEPDEVISEPFEEIPIEEM